MVTLLHSNIALTSLYRFGMPPSSLRSLGGYKNMSGEMFVPPQVQALGLRKDIETEEGMLDFIKKDADHRMTTSSDGNKKIYQAGKSPNLLHIFGGPELPASRFQEVVGGFLWAHHHYMLGMVEDRRGTGG